MEFDEYLSDSDVMYWDIERNPQLRSTILSVLVLDGLPEANELDAMVMDLVEAVPRFRQRVVSDDYDIAPRWEDDPNLELSYHVRRVSVSGGGEMSDLLALAEPIQMQAFDKDRPLWEMYLVDGLKDGRAALIMKLHHVISDGVGLVKMNAALVGKARPSETSRLTIEERRRRLVERARTESPDDRSDRVRGAIRHRVDSNRAGLRRITSGLGSLVSDMVRDPQGTIEITRDTLGSIGRLFGGGGEAVSPVMADRSMGVNLNCVVVPLNEVKEAGKKLGGSVNDVFLTAVAGAMNRYHVHMGKPVDELRMAMPVNMRETDESGDKAGNQIAGLRIMVPISIADPSKRLHEIKARTHAALGERALKLFGDIVGITTRLPKGVTESMVRDMTKSADFATSNVPGPRRTVESGGMKVLSMIPFGPPSGAALNITLFSYAGNCHIGITSDRAAVTEPAIFCEALEKSFAELFSANGGPPS